MIKPANDMCEQQRRIRTVHSASLLFGVFNRFLLSYQIHRLLLASVAGTESTN